MATRRPGAMVLGLLGVGCIRPAAYPCEMSSQCDTQHGGMCQLPAGYCSYPDDDCASQQRYESRAPGTLAGACVEPDSTGSDTDADSGTDAGTESGDGSTGPVACGEAMQPCCEDDACAGANMCFGDACGCTFEVISGDFHTCTYRFDDQFRCWGGNIWQELGRDDDGQFSPDAAPVAGLPSPLFFTSMAARLHTCVVAVAGAVYCWGLNASAQADPDDASDTVRTARKIADRKALGWEPGLVAAGLAHTCLGGVDELDDPHVLCFGSNDVGQLGAAAPGEAVDMTPFEGTLDDITAGGYHTCIRTGGGDADMPSPHLYCWGLDDSGQLGAGAGDQTGPTAHEIDLPRPVRSFAAGDGHTCAVVGEASFDAENEVYCWGDNEFGQVTGVAGGWEPTPVLVPGLPRAPWHRISTTSQHTCVASFGEAWCWGNNEDGRVSPFEPPDVLPPTPIDTGDEIAGVFNVAAGASHTCAVATDGRIWCWGCGMMGQLGNETLGCTDESGEFGRIASHCD